MLKTREALLRRRLGRTNAFLLRFLGEALPDDDALRSALTTAAVALLFTIVAPLYAVLVYLLERPPSVYYLLAALALLTALSSLVLLRRGVYRFASYFLLAGGTFCVTISYLLEGSRGQAAGNFVIVIVMAALLVGWRGVAAVGVPSAALIFLGAWAEERGLVHPPQRQARGVFALMQVTTTLSMLMFFDGVRLAILRARQELETQLAQAQRLEALGRVAGGVAHDFNNLLTVILASESLLTRKSREQGPVEELTLIRNAATRAAQLTRQLLAFSRQQRLEPRTVDLALLLAEEHTMLRRVIPESIKLGLQRPPSAVWVHADPGQLSQVILNLALNARDALPNGGELSLSLEVSDTLAVLRVKDNGLGMNADTLERVFEPFFSTKGPQAGTGLGLATVHGIVTQSGGSIYVTSEPGGGSEFRVTFPLAAEPPASADTPADAQSSALPPSTVLLVEDDPVIRATSARLLQEMGLEVIESASAADALSRYRKAPHAVDLVLTDIVMPGGSGPDLLRQLCAERPVRALFMSGYLDDAQRDPLLTRVPFLAKPFNFDELRRKLRIALGSPPIDPAG